MTTTYQWNRYDEYKTMNDRVGEYYATVHQCLAQAIEHTLTDRCRLGLDIRCGHGESSRLLSRFADRVIGIDPSDEQIRMARDQELGEKFEFECCSFDDFQPPGEKFDIATAVWHLNLVHTEKAVQGVIKKMRDVLQPGGTIALVIPSDAFTSRRAQATSSQSFEQKQAWYEETETYTRGVTNNGKAWTPTTAWQPMWLMRQLSEHFEIRAWDVKGTVVAERRLVGLDSEPPFEVLHGRLR